MHSRQNNARIIRGSSARPLAYTITQKELYARSSKAFRDFAGVGPGAAAVVADVLECSKATAKNYLEGRNVPSGILDLRAYHAVPPYAAMKREIAAMEANMDPRLQAKLAEFHQFMSQYGDVFFNQGE